MPTNDNRPIKVEVKDLTKRFGDLLVLEFEQRGQFLFAVHAGLHVDVLDVRFGSLWTNIPRKLFLQTGIQYGDRVSITIENDTRTVYRNIIQFAKSFADVYVGEALAYINSLDCVAVAINQGSFARAYNIGTGNSWRIRIEPFRGFL